MAKTIRNTFIIFLVSGFWHGANWTFLMWGGLNALFIMPSVILKTNRKNLDTVAQGKLLPNLKELTQLITTFLLASFAWIFFRSETISGAFTYIKEMLSNGLFEAPSIISGSTLLLVILFIIIEWIGRENKYAIEKIGLKWKTPLRWTFYYALILLVILLGGEEQEFIYFQF